MCFKNSHKITLITYMLCAQWFKYGRIKKSNFLKKCLNVHRIFFWRTMALL